MSGRNGSVGLVLPREEDVCCYCLVCRLKMAKGIRKCLLRGAWVSAARLAVLIDQRSLTYDDKPGEFSEAELELTVA